MAARPERAGDVVLARKDLGVAYHLAVVVDDALQGVTHVIRGADLFEATHIQRLLQALLDLPTPSIATTACCWPRRQALRQARPGRDPGRSARPGGCPPLRCGRSWASEGMNSHAGGARLRLPRPAISASLRPVHEPPRRPMPATIARLARFSPASPWPSAALPLAAPAPFVPGTC